MAVHCGLHRLWLPSAGLADRRAPVALDYNRGLLAGLPQPVAQACQTGRCARAAVCGLSTLHAATDGRDLHHTLGRIPALCALAMADDPGGARHPATVAAAGPLRADGWAATVHHRILQRDRVAASARVVDGAFRAASGFQIPTQDHHPGLAPLSGRSGRLRALARIHLPVPRPGQQRPDRAARPGQHAAVNLALSHHGGTQRHAAHSSRRVERDAGTRPGRLLACGLVCFAHQRLELHRVLYLSQTSRSRRGCAHPPDAIARPAGTRSRPHPRLDDASAAV